MNVLQKNIERIKVKYSEGMAVPKKRRSKAKGKVRLSNWKRKSVAAAQKAFNFAKKMNKTKKEEKIIPSPDSKAMEIE